MHLSNRSLIRAADCCFTCWFYTDEDKRPYYLKGEPSKEIYNTRGHTRVYPTLVRSSKTAVGSNELRVFF